jgi:hypothetical protein
MFASTNEKALEASYSVSLCIVMAGKPHTIGGRFILPAAEELAFIMRAERVRNN